MRKIIIKNRRNNKDEQVLTLDEFKAKFKNELTSAIPNLFTRPTAKRYVKATIYAFK